MDREIRIGLTPRESATIEHALNKQKDILEEYLTVIPYGKEKDFAQEQIVTINAIIRKIKLEYLE